jgi:hypothetical protein
MKKFKSLLSASFLTAALSMSAFAGSGVVTGFDSGVVTGFISGVVTGFISGVVTGLF